MALLLLSVTAGCFNTQTAEFAGNVRQHVEPMKPVYEQGVLTYPGATPEDQAIYREHMVQLGRLLDAGEGKKSQ
jgi:hypothetical protein